jgi:hypothetical protein
MNCTNSAVPTLKLDHWIKALALLCRMVVEPGALPMLALPLVTTPPCGAASAKALSDSRMASVRACSAKVER